MKLEVEISEEGQDWMRRKGMDFADAAEWLGNLVNGYADGFIEAERQRAGRAIALLKADAMRSAIGCAKPGESGWEIERRADEIVNGLIGRN